MTEPPRCFQLRRYLVREGKIDVFLKLWRAEVKPLRERFGFRVEGAWVAEQGRRFVWVISHHSRSSFQRSECLYYESPDRLRMDDPAAHLLEIETLEMDAVEPYPDSPPTELEQR